MVFSGSLISAIGRSCLGVCLVTYDEGRRLPSDALTSAANPGQQRGD